MRSSIDGGRQTKGHQFSISRYFALTTLAFFSLLSLTWAYVIVFPMAFMDVTFASVKGKEQLSRECLDNATLFVGDSRVEAGLVPAIITSSATNLGIASGSNIEARAVLNHNLTCPTLPRLVVFSIAPRGFEALQPGFWTSSLGYGLLGFGDVAEIENIAWAAGDMNALLSASTPDGMRGPVRDWLYAARFPTLYFSHLIAGRAVQREGANENRVAETLRTRGFVARPPHGRWTDRSEPVSDSFRPSPLQDRYFRDILTLLAVRGVNVLIVDMPVRLDTKGNMSHGYMSDFHKYMSNVLAAYPNAREINDAFPEWPPEAFADDIHLDPSGAKLMSLRLAACLKGSVCEWGWQ